MGIETSINEHTKANAYLQLLINNKYQVLIYIIFSLFSTPAIAETVFVKYRGAVDLAPFECKLITRSSLIKRLCYDPKESYVIVNLTGTYYHYCEVPTGIVASWYQADSMGRYYNARIKGQYDCRVYRMPLYQ